MRILFVLLMAVELVNDCVAFPHQINWRERPKWSRRWQTEIAPGVTSAEDRSTGATQPHQALEFQLTTFSIQERAMLNARLLAARKSGRACCPFWGRGQRIAEPVAQPWEMSLGNAAVVQNLVPGQIYYWQKGQWDIELTCPNGITLTESGYFGARGSTVAVIYMTDALVPGPVYPALTKEIATEGLWPWAPGQYAFFIRPFRAAPPNVGCENRDVQIDCGVEAAATPWLPDTIGTGGATVTPVPAPTIDRAGVLGWEAPPEAVYKSARNISALNAALEATWSELMQGWVVNLVPGQTYFYVEGENDGAGLATFNSHWPGGMLNLTDSGVFVNDIPNAPWAVIYAPQDGSPGTVHLGQVIEYEIEGLIVGVECAVRLHFAELESGFDGSVARRQFRASVAGEQVVSAVIEPYVAAGQAMNAAVTADFVALPDPDGKLTITLTPEPPYFCAGMNGVEVFQRTWEVVELTTGTTDNLLKWTTPLKGMYPADTLVYPVFFGRPKTAEATALTGQHADLRFRIEEPLGDGVLGVNACPAEVCIPDPILEAPPPVETPDYPSTLLPGGSQWEPFWEFDGVSHAAGYSPGGDPPEGLWPGVLEEWSAQVLEKWEEFKAEQQLTVSAEQLVWIYVYSPGDSRWYANGIFGTDPPSTSGAAAYDWTIGIDYTV